MGKRKAACGEHGSHKTAARSPGVGRQLPTLAPRATVANPINVQSEPRYKRPRVNEDIQNSAPLVDYDSLGLGTRPLIMDDASTSYSETPDRYSVSGTNILFIDHELAVLFGGLNELEDNQATSIGEGISLTLPPLAQNPSMYRSLAPEVKICAACDAMLTTLRHTFMAIPDTAIKMQVLEGYFALRDNWHACHTRGV